MSKFVSLRSICTLAMVSVLLLVSACAGSGAHKSSPPSGSSQGFIFKSVAECMKAGSSEADCSKAFQGAVKEANATTPSFPNADDCARKWGKCERHDRDGHDYYFPMLMAFMVIQNDYYWPLYGNFLYAQPVLSLYSGASVGYYSSSSSVYVNQTTVNEVNDYYNNSTGKVEQSSNNGDVNDDVYQTSDDNDGTVTYNTSDLSQCADSACDTTGGDTTDGTSVVVESGSTQEGVTTQSVPSINTDNQADTVIGGNSDESGGNSGSSVNSDESGSSGSYSSSSGDSSSSSSDEGSTSSSGSSDDGE